MTTWTGCITSATRSSASGGTSTSSSFRIWRWWCGTPTDRSRSTESRSLSPPNLLGCTAVGFLAGLVLVPLTGAPIGAALGGAGTIIGSIEAAGVSNDFVRNLEALMKPGTSALFVLGSEGDMEVILRKIHGLSGTIWKTNVDGEHAR